MSWARLDDGARTGLMLSLNPFFLQLFLFSNAFIFRE
ncbi:hypothetical protein CTW3_03765 [Chlamydia trachomatis C/TW-3]|nr:hypothetical protein CTW3_03765 [Chlamydia trachomatis C/TW-3]AKR33071.1 hypothetical protein DCS63711_03750 [Chlamydia trachomatis D/CS637/11]